MCSQNVKAFGLSHSQKRIWFNCQLDFVKNSKKGRKSYNLVMPFKISGDIDFNTLERSIGIIVERHDILRTCFRIYDNEPYQFVYNELDFEIEYDDEIIDENSAKKDAANCLFDLDALPLFKLKVYHLDEGGYLGVFVFHHIIFDGWSSDLFFKELIENYVSLQRGVEPLMQRLDTQFYDFAAWQNENLVSGELSEEEAFWLSELSNLSNEFELPKDRERPKNQDFEGACLPLEIGASLTSEIKRVCHESHVSVYSFLLASFFKILNIYSHAKDIVVGSSFHGRAHIELNEIIGCFINTLPIRMKFGELDTFHDLLQSTFKKIKSIIPNQEYPLDKIIEQLKLPRDLSKNPLFTVLFEYHNWDSDNKYYDNDFLGNGLVFSRSDYFPDFSIFDIAVEISENDEKLVGFLQYSTSIFDLETIHTLRDVYVSFLEEACKNKHMKLDSFSALTEAERGQIDSCFNNTETRLPLAKTICESLEERVREMPEHIALQEGARQLNYREVWESVEHFASVINSLGVKPNDFVAVYHERSIELIVGALAIFKNGATYVPIDPRLPKERVEYILNDSKPSVLLSNRSLFQNLSEKDFDGDCQVLFLEDLKSFEGPTSTIENRANSSSRAYMIYTSGTTGKPKGVVVRHDGMVNHIFAKINDLKLSQNDSILQSASISFDISIWQMFTVFVSGGCVSIISDEHLLDPELFLNHIQKHRVTIIEAVPSLLVPVLEAVERKPRLLAGIDSLSYIISTGEELSPSLAKRIIAQIPGVYVVNAYGPTEASDDITHFIFNKSEEINDLRIPIGKPILNTKLYVVGNDNQLVPIGVKGEICVSGVGVGDGYWKRRDITEKAFIANPYCDLAEHKVLYKTGDIGRWLRDGNLEFFGRKDRQIKLRGYRIELGDIENAMQSLSFIDECAVLLKGDSSDDYLVCFYTSNEKSSHASRSIKEQLLEKIPYYMVPAIFERISSFEHNNNGKIDRAALDNYSIRRESETNSDVEEVLTPTEVRLRAIWSSVLGVETMRKNDSFFDIGGHSITAIKVVNQIRKEFEVDLPLDKIFNFPTIESFSVEIDKVSKTTSGYKLMPIEKSEVAEEYAMAPVQLPELYMHELEPDNPFYNISFEMLFTGDLDVEVFLSAWKTIISRHPIMSCSIVYKEGVPKIVMNRENFQRMHDIGEIVEDRSDVSDNDFEEDIKRVIYEHGKHKFDFSNSPLAKIKLITYSKNRTLFLFVTHHIIWDETSSINFVRELEYLYNDIKRGGRGILPELPVNYLDYSKWINDCLNKALLNDSKNYWVEKLKDLPEQLALPLDYPRPPMQTFNGGTILARFSDSQRERIHRYCHENGVTLYMFLLTVLNLFVYKITNQKDFIIGSPIVNRDDPALEKLLGLFASAIFLRAQFDSTITFSALLAETKKTSIEAFEHHLYPSNLVLDELNINADLSRFKLFNIMFGVQNDKNALLNDLDFQGVITSTRLLEFKEDNSRFDLTLAIDDIDNVLEVNLNYNSDIFLEKTAQRFVDQYVGLVDQVLEDATLTLDDYGVLTENDLSVMESLSEKGGIEEIPEGLIQNRFESIAKHFPDTTALLFGKEELTYKVLNSEANKLARDLMLEGVQVEDRVALSYQPGTSMVIAILAILKSGGVFVPLASDYPVERVKNIIAQTNAAFLIAEDGRVFGESVGAKVLDYRFDYQADETQYQACDQNPETRASSANLAYIIFTSGSTGSPKGIEIQHGGVLNLFNWYDEHYPLSVEDRSLMITSFTFDASILEYLWPLTTGASVVILNEESRVVPARIGQEMKAQRVSFAQFVPEMLSAFLDSLNNHDFEKTDSLKYLISGGSALSRSLRDQVITHFDCRFSNHYGPTECSVDNLFFNCREAFIGDVVPLGSPMASSRIYILNEHHQEVPIGVIGEICIEGVGLARGYCNDLERTESSFIVFKNRHGDTCRIYKTGDLGRYDEKGIVYYEGRMDHQVKIRGNRVELGEIDARLLHIKEVRNACTLFSQDKSGDGIFTYVDLNNNFNSIKGNGETHYRFFTLTQLPSCKKQMDHLHNAVWPEYFVYAKANREFWPKIYSLFPEHQITVFDDSVSMVSVGNAVPFYWDGKDETIPTGWDDALIKSFSQHRAEVSPNTLLVLAGIVDEKYRGQGISEVLLKILKQVAFTFGYSQVLIPVRPTEKQNYPALGISEYSQRTDKTGNLVDPWLRVHQRVGGRILGYSEDSQFIEAPLDFWNRLHGKGIESSGWVEIDGCLSLVEVDIEKGLGVYREPCVWVAHDVASYTNWSNVSPMELKAELKKALPAYMMPNRIIIEPHLPYLANGKVDRKALDAKYRENQEVEKIYQPPQKEDEAAICEMWANLLDEEKVGMSDNFFELGGSSLKAISLLSKFNKKYKCNLGLRAFLEEPTPIKMCEFYLGYRRSSSTEMVRIKIDAAHSEYNDCFEDQLLSVVRTLAKCSGELIFAKAWNFAWNDEPGHCLGDRVSAGTGIQQALECAGSAYGIGYRGWHIKGIEDLIERSKTALIKGELLIIMDDSFFCPWDPLYLKRHGQHSCIIVGVDEDNQQFLCTDAYNAMYNIEYKFEDLKKGLKEDGYTFYSEAESPPRTPDLHGILELIVSDISNGALHHRINDFSKLVLEHQAFYDEFSGVEKLEDSPLFRNAHNVMRKRVQMTYVCNELLSTYGSVRLGEIKAKFETVANHWKTVLALFTKFYFTKNERMKTRASELISEIAEKEVEIWSGIREILTRP